MKIKKSKFIMTVTLIILVLAAAVAYLLFFAPKSIIKIGEASVKINVPKSLSDLIYVSSDATPNAYYFSTKKLTALDDQCSPSAISMGAMYVFSDKTSAEQQLQVSTDPQDGKVTVKALLKELDGKFYVFDGGSNLPCSNNDAAVKLQKKQANDFIDAGNTIKKL